METDGFIAEMCGQIHSEDKITETQTSVTSQTIYSNHTQQSLSQQKQLLVNYLKKSLETHREEANGRFVLGEGMPFDLEIKNNYSVLIVKPSAGCSTKEVFAIADKKEFKPVDIDTVLKALKEKGYLLGVVTNKGLPLTIYSLEICHIDSFFDVIISADDVAIPKPDPSGIKKAMESLNIKNNEDVLYVGDNDIDYFTAENAGVDCMLVSWGPRVIKCIDQAKYEAKSYNEMRDIVL